MSTQDLIVIKAEAPVIGPYCFCAAEVNFYLKRQPSTEKDKIEIFQEKQMKDFLSYLTIVFLFWLASLQVNVPPQYLGNNFVKTPTQPQLNLT